MSQLRAAADRLRDAAAAGEPVPATVLEAVADLLAVEDEIRSTQPRGFYEVADADTVATAVLDDFVHSVNDEERSNTMKERWGFRTNPVRVIVLVVLGAVLGVIIGLGAEATFLEDDAEAVTGVSGAAVGASLTVQATECHAVGGKMRCIKPAKRHRRAARKINNGTIPHTRKKFDMRRAWKEPRKARRIFVRRIKAAMIASQGTPEGEKIACCTEGAAAAAYVSLMDAPICAGVGRVMTLEEQFNHDMMCRIARMPEKEKNKVDTRRIKVGMTIFFCGAVVGGGVAATGGTGLAALAVAGGTVGGCSLTVWDQLD